jgi:hypothetical protein
MAWAVFTIAPASRKDPMKNRAETVGRMTQDQEKGRRPESLASARRIVGITDRKRYQVRKFGNSLMVPIGPPIPASARRVDMGCRLNGIWAILESITDLTRPIGQCRPK